MSRDCSAVCASCPALLAVLRAHSDECARADALDVARTDAERVAQYEGAQKDAWRSVGLKAIDLVRQLEDRLAAADGNLDRRYLRAWEERRREWEAEAWAAGLDAARRVA